MSDISLNATAANLVLQLHQSFDSDLSAPALWTLRGDQYQSLSRQALMDRIDSFAAALFHLGIREGDRVAILSENRPEWVISDMALMSLGAVGVPIYPTSSLEDIGYILQHSQVKMLCISTQAQWQRISDIPRVRMLAAIITFEPFSGSGKPPAFFEDLIALGQAILRDHPELINQQRQKVGRDHLATVIYTSGTTGVAKGVMLTHGNFLANYEGCRERIQVTPSDISMSFLPLSHVFERLAGYYFILFSGASIAYAQSMQTVVDDMQIIRPTVAPAVPRFYEKVYARIMEKISAAPGRRQKLFHAALQLANRVKSSPAAQESSPIILQLLFQLADFLILKKIRAVFGGRMRFFISGGAPLSANLAKFFHSCGVLILEGYGLTETSPVIAVNDEYHYRFGTVGKPLINCEVKIAEDGEILLRGPSVMKGYLDSDEATRSILQNGWFYTGDIGELSADGYLRITDRKKDIIKTSGGKMVAPQKLERAILSDPLYAQAVVLGDQRQYLVALLVPNKTELLQKAAQWGVRDQSWAEVICHPKVMECIRSDLKIKMQPFASFEQIKYFELLPSEFTVEAGELTPTLKVKRRFIQQKYQAVLDKLYAHPHQDV